MITARPQKDLSSAKNYFRQHLLRGDYHSENRSIQGQWFGLGAGRLGLDLAAPVTEEAFVRLCENRHPLTGAQLTVRHRRKDRRVFYDFVASAPKSVSLLALTVGDARIVAAHDESCRAAMQQMEALAAARIRQGGQRSERLTGEITAAVFRHEESRALDPQLHTHFVVFNATFDPVENRWKALETSRMFEHINLFTEVYRSELALRLRGLGYSIRNAANGFEIEGVSPELIQRFSKRRRTILAEEARLTAKAGKSLSNDARAAVSRATRQAKRTDLAPEALQAQQRAQLTAEEQATLERLVRTAVASEARGAHPSPTPRLQLGPAVEVSSPGQQAARGTVRPEPNPEAAKAAIDFARDHLFERHSVVGRPTLLAAALKFGRGAVDLPALQAELRRRTEFIAVGTTLTTKDALRQEQRLIALVNQGLGGCRPLHPGFSGSRKLSVEQRQALQFILRSPDEVIALRGHAGTGKTRLLTELVQGVEERYAVVVLAPMAAAVEVLREKGFQQAATVQRFLADPDFQQLAAGKALIVDEAGFLSLRDLLAVVEVTRALHCRLILSGDTRQHHGVEAGDALRLLETHSSLRTVQIQNIQRQVDREYRAAIGELAQGEGLEALRRLERLGAVHEVEDEFRYQLLADAYAASVKAGKSALAVSPTWREIEQVTTEVRARLKIDGRLATEETEVTTHHGLKWTRAQKRDLRNYAPGLVLTFHKATQDFRANEWGELTRIEGNLLLLAKPDGTTARISRKQADCFEVAEKQKLPVAVGERLLLQGNRKADGLFNGQIVTVEAIHPDGSLRVDGRRTIAPDFRAFTYGYCVTSHASQGRTVDHVLIAVNSETAVAANLSQFYVSASRGREQVQIYTDDLDFLRQAVQRPGTRLSATELVERVRLAARETASPRPRASQRQAL